MFIPHDITALYLHSYLFFPLGIIRSHTDDNGLHGYRLHSIIKKGQNQPYVRYMIHFARPRNLKIIFSRS
jgi:hypothetical protein